MFLYESKKRMSKSERKAKKKARDDACSDVTVETGLANSPPRIPKIINKTLTTNYFALTLTSCVSVFRIEIESPQTIGETSSRSTASLRAQFETFQPKLRQLLGSQAVLCGQHILAISKHKYKYQEGDAFVIHLEDVGAGPSSMRCTYTSALASLSADSLTHLVKRWFVEEFDMLQIGKDVFGQEYIPINSDYHSIKVLKGFSFSVNASCSLGTQLVIDPTHLVLHKQSAREEMESFRRLGGKRAIERAFRGVSVLSVHNMRLWRVQEIDFDLSLDSLFEVPKGSGNTVSFRNYFLRAYPDLALESWMRATAKPGLLLMVSKSAPKSGGMRVFLPPELCFRTGITDKSRRSRELMNSLDGLMKFPCSVRHNKASNFVRQVMETKSAKPRLFDIDLKSSKVEATELSGYTLQIGRRRVLLPQRARNFSHEVKSTPPCQERVSSLKKWVLISEAASRGVVLLLGELMRKEKGGISREDPSYRFIDNFREGSKDRLHVTTFSFQSKFISDPLISQNLEMQQSWRLALKSEAAKKGCQVLVCVLPSKDKSLYSMVKSQSMQIGITSQCVLASTLSNLKSGVATTKVCSNILRQIMTKLGNLKWKVCIPHVLKETMVVGFGSSATGSMAQGLNSFGFVSTFESSFSNFHSAGVVVDGYRGQPKSEQLTMLMSNAVKVYKAKNKETPPQSIVVFRESFGSMQGERSKLEVEAFKRAFRNLDETFDPKMTVISIQSKLVKTRLFRKCPVFMYKEPDELKSTPCPHVPGCQGLHRFHNPAPGTLVDTGIVAEGGKEFYLVSCSTSEKFSSRPILCRITTNEEKNFKTREIAELTDAFANFYSPMPHAVRLPSPLMNAGRLAQSLGLTWIGGTFMPSTNMCRHNSYSPKSTTLLSSVDCCCPCILKPNGNLQGKLFFV